ncbi:MAG: hypothetical protein ACRD5J_12320 [Nitrososphaeraceae archaeon]
MQREGQLQNFQNGPSPDDSGVILRVNPTNDIISGTLYYFQPNADRTGISLEKDSPLSDLVADSGGELSPVTIGTGFAGITEIETGSDGNLYLLTFDRNNDGQGSLIKILPTSLLENDSSSQYGISEQEN